MATKYFLPIDYIDTIISACLTRAEYQVVLFIMRKTLGFGKNEDSISRSQLMEVAGLSDRGVKDAVNALCERGLITKTEAVGRGNLNSYSLILEKGKLTSPITVKRGSVVPHLGAKRGSFVQKKGKPTSPTNISITNTLSHKKKKWGSVDSIDSSTINAIAETYQVSARDVEEKWEDLKLWLQSTGKRRKNYKAFLMSCVRKDIKSGNMQTKGELEQEVERRFNELPKIS